MDKDFDFGDVGKRTPYRTPDNFFEDIPQRVMERTYGNKRRKHRLQMIFSAVLASAAVLAGILFMPSLSQTEDVPDGGSNLLAIENNGSEQMDKWIYELSDEELEELVSFSENDIFLN